MNSWMHVVGWTLIHFAWQGAVVGLLAAGTLRLCQRRSANARYAIACAALMTMLASSVITAGMLRSPDVAVGPTVIEPEAVTSPTALSTLTGSTTNDDVTLGRGAWDRVDAL